jgi:hypothetical protein
MKFIKIEYSSNSSEVVEAMKTVVDKKEVSSFQNEVRKY